MKKILICAMFFMPFLMNAQNSEKFQVGAEYGLSQSGHEAASLAFDARYKIMNVGIVNFNAGLNVGLLEPDEGIAIGFSVNPNVTTEFGLMNFRLRPYLGIGYYYSSQKYDLHPEIYSTPEYNSHVKGTQNATGYTIYPGLRYYFKKLIYLNGGLKRFSVRADGLNGFKHNYDSNIIFIGAGFHF